MIYGYIITLSQRELLSLVNLTGLFIVILCVYTILEILYGDWLIKKYDLQNRYSIITKILLLRWSIYWGSFVYNIVLGFFIIIAIMFVNLSIFMGWI